MESSCKLESAYDVQSVLNSGKLQVRWRVRLLLHKLVVDHGFAPAKFRKVYGWMKT